MNFPARSTELQLQTMMTRGNDSVVINREAPQLSVGEEFRYGAIKNFFRTGVVRRMR